MQESQPFGSMGFSTKFDTIPLAKKVFSSQEIPRISQLTIYYNPDSSRDPFCVGMGIQYARNDNKQSETYFLGGYVFLDTRKKDIFFDDDEHITGFDVWSGWYVNKIEITTSKGKKYSVGGPGGSKNSIFSDETAG